MWARSLGAQPQRWARCSVAWGTHVLRRHPSPPSSATNVEEIIGKLREAEVALGQGATVEEVIRRLGISEPTYYRWRREYGGLQLDQAKRLKDLERENARLKKLVAEQVLDRALLR